MTRVRLKDVAEQARTSPGTVSRVLNSRNLHQVGHDRINIMTRYSADGRHQWHDLFGRWRTYGDGQKAHLHPRLVLDRQWMQVVAGDHESKTNHIFLVDVSDFEETAGFPPLTD
jgi:hypothetical protein